MSDLEKVATSEVKENEGTSEITEESNESRVKSRLNEVYDQIDLAEDPAEMTALMVALTEEYGYGLRQANIVNDRQGKNRITVTRNTYRVNEYSMDTEVDMYRQQQIDEMVITLLNMYLSNKQQLPTNLPKKATGILNRVKALYVNLFNTNNYHLIRKLNTPSFMKDYISKVFKLIKESQEDAFTGFIEFLESNDESVAAELTRSIGYKVWGSITTDTNDAFGSVFNPILDKLNNRFAVEKAYGEFRAIFRHSNRAIPIGEIRDIFEFSKNSYDTARKNVFSELSDIAADEGNLKIINSILYER